MSDLQLSMAETNANQVGKIIHEVVLTKVQAAIKFATTEVAVRTTAEMKGLIDKKRPYTKKGKKKIYAKGNPPEPPQIRTGYLKKNIKYTIKQNDENTYIATIAPYAIYARRLEFGGGKWKHGTRYPFVEPTAKIMRANNLAREIYAKALRTEMNK